MRLKQLRGLPVIDPTAARRIGTVQHYQVDPASGQLAALDVESVEHAEGQRVLAGRIRRVGRHAVILTPKGGTTPGTPAELNEQWLDTSTLVGLEVMGDDGNRVGHLVDAAFDQDSLEIEAYLLNSGGLLDRLFGGRGRIQPDKVHACSRELMIFTTGRLKELPEVSSVEEAASPATTAAPDTYGPRTPIKAEDRLPAPSYEPVADGKPVGARRT